MPTVTDVLDRLARYGLVIGAALFAIDIFAIGLGSGSPLGRVIWVVAALFTLARPVIGAVRGFRAGLRDEPANQPPDQTGPAQH